MIMNFSFIVILMGYLKANSALKCYHCVAIECTQSQIFCQGVNEYVLSQLPDIYHGYDGEKISMCPSPTDEVGWEKMQRDTRYQCREERPDGATCVLGRFRVTTEILETGKNITSHGTSLGCAKVSLLKQTKQAVMKGKFDMSSTTSKLKNSLRHYLEIEHCAQHPDMCHKFDFCVPPYATKIKKFHDEPTKTHWLPFAIFLGIILLIALAAIVLTFLAPFFNG